MPRRNDDYHGGGSGWRFSWRIDRLRTLHELGRAFALTEDSGEPDDTVDREPAPDQQTRGPV